MIAKRGAETTAITEKGEKFTRNASHFKKFRRLSQNEHSFADKAEERSVEANKSDIEEKIWNKHECVQPNSDYKQQSSQSSNTTAGTTSSRQAYSPSRDPPNFSSFLPQVNSTPANFRGLEEEDPVEEPYNRYPQRDRKAPRRLCDSNHAE